MKSNNTASDNQNILATSISNSSQTDLFNGSASFEQMCLTQVQELLAEQSIEMAPGANQESLAQQIKQAVQQVLSNNHQNMVNVLSDAGNSDHSDDHDAHKEHVLEFVGFMMICFILIVYLTIGSYMEHKMFKWGHETGVIIFFGIIISVIISAIEHESLDFIQWNNTLFFDLLLPLIIFTTGYNIRRKKFFSNIVNISKFGVVGTVLTFAFLTTFTIALFSITKLTKWKYNNGTWESQEWTLDIYSIAYMCAILTGSDIIAFVTLVKFEEYPTLFSIVLGEGLYNDVVVIILYETMKNVAESDEENKGLHPVSTPFTVIGNFFKISICSILIGLIFGVLATLMTKKFRFISHSAVFESTLLISFAMFGYLLSELLNFSAICSLLVTSIVFSHYTWYNLSPQGQHVTALTFQTLGYGAEALVFAYIGLTSCHYLLNYWVSWQFILAQLIFVVVARTAAIFISYYCFECCKGSKANKLSNREIMFAVYAAYIRGAIAFGLSMNLTDEYFGNLAVSQEERSGEVQVVQSTILGLVIITTFFFGGFTPMVKQCLMGSQDAEEEEQTEIKQPKIIVDSIMDQMAKDRAQTVEAHLNPSTADALIKKDTSILMSEGRQSNMSAMHRVSGQYSNAANNQSQMIDKIMLSQYINMRKETLEKLNKRHASKDLAEHEDSNQDVRRSTIQEKESPETSVDKNPQEIKLSEQSHYQDFLHPNLEKQAEQEIAITSARKQQCLSWLERIDEMYLRPFLIYKYKKIKKRIEFEFEDILKEYKMIENELNQDSSDDEILKNVPTEYKDLTQELISVDQQSKHGNFGLLSQYVRTKMARQVVSDLYVSTHLSNQSFLSGNLPSTQQKANPIAGTFKPHVVSHEHGGSDKKLNLIPSQRATQPPRNSQQDQFEVIIEEDQKDDESDSANKKRE